jgi:hypothetical protein
MVEKLKEYFNRFRLLLILLLFIATPFALFPLALQMSERYHIRKVESPPPAWFPVLVFTPGNVDYVRYEELSDYLKTHTDYSFLAPAGQDRLLNEKLLASYERRVPYPDKVPAFEVRQLTPYRESFEFGFYGDSETIVWYEATDKELFPLQYEVTGPLSDAVTFLWTAAASLVIWGVAYGIWKIYRDSRGTAS